MNAKIRITKKFKFEMAHALDFHAGKCKNIHGHSYTLLVKVLGKVITGNTASKGMVMDFVDLKDIVNQGIVEELDHALLLQKDSPYIKLLKGETNQKLKLVDYQPTCENMLVDFSNIISKHLPFGVTLYSLYLQETSTSFAEWYASDNQ